MSGCIGPRGEFDRHITGVEVCPRCGVWDPDAAPTSSSSTAQQLVAEALDDLVMSKGVVLDGDRLDWLVEWVDERVRNVLTRVEAHLQSLIDDDAQPDDWKAGLVLGRLIVEGHRQMPYSPESLTGGPE